GGWGCSGCGPDGPALSCLAPFADLRGGADADAGGEQATFQRTLLSSLTASAVNTWVPSGRSGCSNVTGMLNNGSKPLRTNSLPSLRLMKTEIGPCFNARTASRPGARLCLPGPLLMCRVAE